MVDSWYVLEIWKLKQYLVRSPKYENISNFVIHQTYFWKTISTFWCIFLKTVCVQIDRAFPFFLAKNEFYNGGILINPQIQEFTKKGSPTPLNMPSPTPQHANMLTLKHATNAISSVHIFLSMLHEWIEISSSNKSNRLNFYEFQASDVFASRIKGVRSPNLTFPWCLDFWTPGTPYFWILIYGNILKQYYF